MSSILYDQRSRIETFVVEDPASGQIVEVKPGHRLDVRFTSGLVSRWEIEECPLSLVPLLIGRAAFSFIVFRSHVGVEELVLRRVGGVRSGETRVLRVASAG